MIYFPSKSEITRLFGLSILSQISMMRYQPTWTADHHMKPTIFTSIVQPKQTTLFFVIGLALS